MVSSLKLPYQQLDTKQSVVQIQVITDVLFGITMVFRIALRNHQ